MKPVTFERIVVAVEPRLGRTHGMYLVTFHDCGHQLEFAVEVHRGERRHCSACFDAWLAEQQKKAAKK